MTTPDSGAPAVATLVHTPADAPAATDRWVRVRRYAAALFAIWVVVILVRDGVPTDRGTLMGIVVLGLAITCIGRGWRSLLRVLVDWLPFSVVLMLYDKSRSVATVVSMPLHEGDVAGAERRLFGGHIPTVVLQNHLYDPTAVHWFDALMTVIYSSHFLATPVVAAVLWLRDRTAWIGYITRVVVLAFAGLVTYVLFPEAPPWLAARDGFIDPVTRLSARGWIWLHLGNVHELLEGAQRDGSNPVAAMPSLHTAFAALIALFLAARLGTPWRRLLALYPIAMGFALVYLGEHYVLDIAAGFAYAAAVHWGVSRWERSRVRGRIEVTEPAPVG